MVFVVRTRESTSRQKEDTPMDLYNLLSISRTANDNEIKRAYLVKAKELHLDKNPGDKKVEESFERVNQSLPFSYLRKLLLNKSFYRIIIFYTRCQRTEKEFSE